MSFQINTNVYIPILNKNGYICNVIRSEFYPNAEPLYRINLFNGDFVELKKEYFDIIEVVKE